MRFAELDAVTVDAFGTLLELNDPTAALTAAAAEHGIVRPPGEIAEAFRAEARYYRPRSYLGRDAASLQALRHDCVGVFLETLGAELEPESFADAFVGALSFAPAPGAVEAIARLAPHVELAVVANWDISLHEHLERLGLDTAFAAIVTSAEAGAVKPDPAIFTFALERLGATAERALHVGDEPADEEGARAAGMRFLPAPLATAFEGWQ
jgi:putative hydrolase of the HAD superfamily